MPVQKITREEIIEKAFDVFNRRGFHRTSMNDLATACDLFKGSFYHYFGSKEELMREVLQYNYQLFKQTTLSIAYDESLPPKERLRKMLEKQTHIVSKDNRGCLFGNTTLETANAAPEFRPILQAFFDDWTATLTHVFESKYGKEEARAMAQQTIMEIEGAVMLMKLCDNPQLLTDCRDRILSRL